MEEIPESLLKFSWMRKKDHHHSLLKVQFSILSRVMHVYWGCSENLAAFGAFSKHAI